MVRYILEIIGTVAFSVSGAVVAIQKKMDILGVTTLGVITALGGGIFRDILIGKTPPTAFNNPLYALVAIVAAIITFLPVVSKRINLDRFIWVFVDSIGLGAFTMIGVSAGTSFNNVFFEIFLGVTTGVGGGVVRDICAGNLPMIFIKHFYACPCIIGAVVFVILNGYNANIAVILGFTVIVALRLLAAKYKWHLPKAK
ncbi:MAG: trimeric intracellular cation channel family protein [Clostridia bacterium]|nr:trimeric intracellular cation channel family protein [Clostridia bacterium]